VRRYWLLSISNLVPCSRQLPVGVWQSSSPWLIKSKKGAGEVKPTLLNKMDQIS
jgi:hypothetical protein